jgi:hypothetical protein
MTKETKQPEPKQEAKQPELTVEQLKVMHFDNQGQMNFLKQQNQAILQELQKRVENK